MKFCFEDITLYLSVIQTSTWASEDRFEYVHMPKAIKKREAEKLGCKDSALEVQKRGRAQPE